MVEISEETGQLIVRISGQEYTRYRFSADCWKPYLFPLRAVNGLSLLADSPTDHRHHHGLWVGHGRVNENDFWLERHNSGRIVHDSFKSLQSGEAEGGFTAANRWVNQAGDTVLNDTRTFTFYDMPSDARWFDFEILLTSPNDEIVTLQPTNEAGIPHVRAAEGLTVKTGGRLTNSEGQLNEKGTYRQKAVWLDCSGTLGRLSCGFALFNHPDNPENPVSWFTRDYGPFAPNESFFAGEPILIGPDSPLQLRYRFYTHSGNAEEGDVGAAYEAYRHSVRGLELVSS